MTGTTDALVLDLVEWIAREPRLYSEVIETWRTSCPRLTIWEDAVDRGYVARRAARSTGLRVTVTEGGAKFLREHGRYPARTGLLKQIVDDHITRVAEFVRRLAIDLTAVPAMNSCNRMLFAMASMFISRTGTPP